MSIDISTWHVGDNIVVPVSVLEDGVAMGSVGPVEGRLLLDDSPVGVAVSLNSSATGADWPQGVFVFDYPVSDSLELEPGVYKIALNLGDINRTVKSIESIQVLQNVFE